MVPPGEYTTSVGSTVADVFSSNFKIEPSFFWLRLRCISIVAASNKSIPGHLIPLSLALAGVEGTVYCGSSSAGQSSSVMWPPTIDEDRLMRFRSLLFTWSATLVV